MSSWFAWCCISMDCGYSRGTHARTHTNTYTHAGARTDAYAHNHDQNPRQTCLLLIADERPFKCPDCPASFKHKTSLRCHYNNHTKKKEYKCDVEEGCTYRTYDFWNYKSHVKHHKSKYVFTSSLISDSSCAMRGGFGAVMCCCTVASSFVCAGTGNLVIVFSTCIFGRFNRSLPKEKVTCEICGAVVGKTSYSSHKKMHSNEGAMARSVRTARLMVTLKAALLLTVEK